MSNASVDRLLAAELSGPEKIRALLRARGHTFVSFSQKYSLWPQSVSNVLSGDRDDELVRKAFAAELEVPLATIDALLAATA